MTTRLLLLVIAFVAGCSGSTPSPAPPPETPTSAPVPVEQPAEAPASGAFSGHALPADTEYYRDGPQQSRPPDGTLKAGTKVMVIEDAGSYCRIRSENGIVAFIAADAIRPPGDPGPQAAPDLAVVNDGNNPFAFDLYNRLAKEHPGNIFFSPYSISTALAMTYAGARGQTEKEMAQVLHFGLPQPDLHRSFGGLAARLHGDNKKGGYQLQIANRLWGQTGYVFDPAFLQVTRDSYRAGFAQVDFVQQREAARQTINNWVEQQTNNKIKDLIGPDALNDLTRLVLTNAIYFKGTWTSPFEEQLTKDAPFKVTTDQEVMVPLMCQTGLFSSGDAENVQILDMPYGDGTLSMLILLPKRIDGLADVEKGLTVETLNRLSSTMNPRMLMVYVPRFSMTSEFGLGDTLASMGMPSAFGPGADFTGMNPSGELFVSFVIHKAFVDVNELGTEAAAATAVGMMGAAFPESPPTFRADHPFLFLIRHNPTKSILFLGRVVNPKA